MELKRVELPAYYSVKGPTCTCGKPLAYIGATLVLGADTVSLNSAVALGNRLYQCAGCKTVWEAVK